MRIVELEDGGRYMCTLPGKATSGYKWTYTVEGAPNVVTIAVANIPPAYLEHEGGPLPIAYSADVQFTVTALTSGDVTIRFQLRRPWEKNKPPIDERVVHVVVRPRDAG
ncbi:MAG: protease inhibitor I42 family protein [Halobacteriota archaeon]